MKKYDLLNCDTNSDLIYKVSSHPYLREAIREGYVMGFDCFCVESEGNELFRGSASDMAWNFCTVSEIINSIEEPN